MLFFLAGTALVLATVYFSIQPQKKLTPLEVKRANTISAEAAKDSVFAAFTDFGIDDSLCKPLKAKELQKLGVVFGYTVSVPYDLPIPFLLQGIEAKFSTRGAFLSTTEKKTAADFEVTVSDSASWKIYFRLAYNEKIRRPEFRLAQLIKIPKDASEDEIYAAIPGLDNATFLLPLTKQASKATLRLKTAGVKYAVDFSEVSDEQAYKLDPGFSKKRLDQSLDEIMKNFPAIKYVFVKSGSPLSNSIIWAYVRTYLQKRNMKMLSEQNIMPFVPMKTQYEQSMAAALGQAREQKKSIIMTSAADVKALIELSRRAGKFGVELVPIDSVLTK